MNRAVVTLTFTVPLGLEAHRLAQQFCKRQVNQKKAKQVYLNTLSVYAVNFYLQCMEIETNLNKSDSWNPPMQTIMDVADLELTNLGKLECRPVLPDSQVCFIPPEVWSDRIGYVAVRLSESLKEATLLGFVETATTEELPVTQLNSLENLLDRLEQLQTPEPVKIPVKLSQWVEGIIEAGWQTVDGLFGIESANLAFNFRGDGVKLGKLIDFSKKTQQVALLVGLTPASEPEMDIVVEVHPTGDKIYLPSDLQLMVLDEDGVAVMEAQARSTKNIQLEFSGFSGERFSIKIALGDVSVTEAFLI